MSVKYRARLPNSSIKRSSTNLTPAVMRPDMRLWTAIVIIGMCGFAVVRGWEIVHFSRAMANVGSPEKQAEITSIWAAAPDVASAALQADLKEKFDFSDPIAVVRRRAVVSSLLSIKPLSSGDWLSLSRMQLVARQPMEEVLASLRLSTLTGPNEGYVMAERGVFGVALWEYLSPDLKSRTAEDLTVIVFARTPAEGALGGTFQSVLSSKSAQVRDELRQALLTAGLSAKDIEQRLGL